MVNGTLVMCRIAVWNASAYLELINFALLEFVFSETNEYVHRVREIWLAWYFLLQSPKYCLSYSRIEKN